MSEFRNTTPQLETLRELWDRYGENRALILEHFPTRKGFLIEKTELGRWNLDERVWRFKTEIK